MRVILLVVLLLLSLSGVSAQTETRNPRKPAPRVFSVTDTGVLKPDAVYKEAAEAEGFNVFKILPRGNDQKISARGGGAYYSFTSRSHSYDDIPQLGLEKGVLKVGFYGAHYGLMADLGAASLSAVDKSLPEVAFLDEYKPPIYEPEIRKEQTRSHNYSVNGLNFSRRQKAVAGHTYVLRAIGFGESDTMVAFNIREIYPDGSAVIFWKEIKQFEVPKLLYYPDPELKARVDKVLTDPRYSEVSSEVKENVVTLTGGVADGDYAGLIKDVQAAKPLMIINNVRRR
jgi:hypothetical protein